MESAPHLVWITDEQGRLLLSNPRAAESRALVDELQRARGQESTHGVVLRSVNDAVWIRHAFPLTFEGRDLTAWIASELPQGHGDRMRILEEALDGWAEISADGTLEFANQRLATLLGGTLETVCGRRWVSLVHEEDLPAARAALDRMQSGGKAETECRFMRFDGGVTSGWLKLIQSSASDGYYLFVRDTTQQRRFEDQLEENIRVLHETQIQLAARQAQLERMNQMLVVLATTDGLTGLANHRAFQERLTHEVERTRRYGGALSLLMLDVDRFKDYNDEFGHPAGDEILRQLGAAMKEIARKADFPARYGGEEFAVILPETGRQQAVESGERYRAALEVRAWPHRPMTVSVGAATYGESGTTPAELIDAADRALYQAKRRGRNRVVHFDEVGDE